MPEFCGALTQCCKLEVKLQKETGMPLIFFQTHKARSDQTKMLAEPEQSRQGFPTAKVTKPEEAATC